MTILAQVNVPQRVPFRMVDATDGTTEEPGLTPSAFVCGPTGDTYSAGAGGITEISHGDYVYTPTTTEVSAAGILLTRFTGTGAMNARGVPVQIVGFNPANDIQNPAGGSTTLSAAGVNAVQSGLATTTHVQEVEDKIDTVDSNVDAIKAKTDSLTFTVAGVLDAGIYYVNGVQITGNGQSGTEWGPA